MLVAFMPALRRGGLQNRRDRVPMQASSGYFVVTVDSAKDGALGDLGGGEPFAERFDWAGIFVFAKRDRDLVAGLLLVGFRARYVDHESGIRKAEVRYRHRTEFRAAKRSRESNQDQSAIAQAEEVPRACGKQAEDIVQQKWVLALLRDAQGAAGALQDFADHKVFG